MKKSKLKVLMYTAVFPVLTYLCSTPVLADEGTQYTIKALPELSRLRQSGQASGFFDSFGKLLGFLRNICILTVGIAFAFVFLSLIIQAGKLGGASILAPEGNTRKRQEAYDGIMHVIINFGIVGAAGAIFAALSKFMLGI